MNGLKADGYTFNVSQTTGPFARLVIRSVKKTGSFSPSGVDPAIIRGSRLAESEEFVAELQSITATHNDLDAKLLRKVEFMIGPAKS